MVVEERFCYLYPHLERWNGIWRICFLVWSHQLENLLMLVWMCVFGRVFFPILHMSSGVVVLAFVKGWRKPEHVDLFKGCVYCILTKKHTLSSWYQVPWHLFKKATSQLVDFKSSSPRPLQAAEEQLKLGKLDAATIFVKARCLFLWILWTLY